MGDDIEIMGLSGPHLCDLAIRDWIKGDFVCMPVAFPTVDEADVFADRAREGGATVRVEKRGERNWHVAQVPREEDE